MIRTGVDERMEVDPATMRFVFQGASDREYGGQGYGGIPWRLGILELKQVICTRGCSDASRILICHMVWQMVVFPIMNTLVTMDKSGRLVLPGRIRKALQVSPPAAFKAEVMGNKVELTLIPARSGAVLKKRRGLLVVSTGGRKFNAAEAVNVVREECR